MAEPKNPEVLFAVCLKNVGYEASLEPHTIYRVLPDPEAGKDGGPRIIDESGEDYLYPRRWLASLEVPRAVEVSLIGTA